MQKHLATGREVKILDKKIEGVSTSPPPPPASLRDSIQLVVKKSLRTSWTSSFLTGNSQKSAILHSSAPLHDEKSVIFPRGKVPLHPNCILI